MGGYIIFSVRLHPAAAVAAYISLNPNSTEAHYHLGEALYYAGDLAGARRMFAAASQLDEKHALARPAYDALMAITLNKPPALVPPGPAKEKK